MWTPDSIRTTGSIVTITVGLVTAVWFISSLYHRVERLEARVKLLTVAPVIASGLNKTPAANPIAQACADLALKAAEAIRAGNSPASGNAIVELMGTLGCVAPKEP